MPENLYPQLPTAPPISQESFNIEMVRKYYQDIANSSELMKGGKAIMGEISWEIQNSFRISF